MSGTVFPLEPTPDEAQAAIAEEFAFFGDWSERYQYLIDLGRKLPEFPDAWKTEEHRLLGCQSMVWIVPSGDASRLDFTAASDSAIVSRLVFLACVSIRGEVPPRSSPPSPTTSRRDRACPAPVADAQQRPCRAAGFIPRTRTRTARRHDRNRRVPLQAAGFRWLLLYRI
jgi:hypothetical protein